MILVKISQNFVKSTLKILVTLTDFSPYIWHVCVSPILVTMCFNYEGFNFYVNTILVTRCFNSSSLQFLCKPHLGNCALTQWSYFLCKPYLSN